MRKKEVKNRKKPQTVNHFYTNPAYQGDRNFPSKVEIYQYNTADFKPLKANIEEDLRTKLVPNSNNWIEVRGLSDGANIYRICKDISLHGFDIRDLLSSQQVIKVTVYESVVFIIISCFRMSEDFQFEEIKIAFALGNNFLISFQENEDSIFEDVKKAISENMLQVKEKAIDFLLYLLLNAVNSININTIMQMEEELVEIEEQLISGKNPENIQEMLHEKRMHYTHVKRSLVALREEFPNLIQTQNPLIRRENMVYFQNFDDRIRSLFGNLESYHESLISLSDVYYNNNNQIMNEIMKRLTVVSTVFIPLTFLVGVWGMNFKYMPETDWKYGYLFAWIIMAFVGVGTYILMKWRKWF